MFHDLHGAFDEVRCDTFYLVMLLNWVRGQHFNSGGFPEVFIGVQ